MPIPTKHRKKIHTALFIFVILLQVTVFCFWLKQYNEERQLTQSFRDTKKQNLAYVYSNGATKNYFDAENSFMEYLHNYDLKSLTSYRNSLDQMTVYLDSLNRLVSADNHFSRAISHKKQKETAIIQLRKELDALLKVGVYRLTENTNVNFEMDPYNYKKVLQSIRYDSIRVSDAVIKKGIIRRIGDAIAGNYDVKREELQIYMKMVYGNQKKTGSVEDQMKYIFQSTGQHYANEFGELRNTYSNLRERDKELMVINTKILQHSQEILVFYTKSAQEASKIQFDDALANIRNKKNMIGFLLFAMAICTVLLLVYTYFANQYEKRLAIAKKAAENNLEFKNRLIGMLSNEMRAPLNIISNLTQKVKVSNVDKSLDSPINLMYFTSNSLQVTVNQILDFSKNEHMNLELLNSKTNLKSEVEVILESLQSLSDLKKIKLIAHIDSDVENKVWIDNGKLHQLFYNIIGNAIKFTNKGSITVDCKLTSIGNQSRFDVSVKDTGIGISKTDLSKVFDRYYDSKAYKDQISFGAGLGLHLCKEIVSLYGGEIGIESEIQQGTAISFFLMLENAKVLL